MRIQNGNRMRSRPAAYELEAKVKIQRHEIEAENPVCRKRSGKQAVRNAKEESRTKMRTRVLGGLGRQAEVVLRDQREVDARRSGERPASRLAHLLLEEREEVAP